jgi:hypothetical protein
MIPRRVRRYSALPLVLVLLRGSRMMIVYICSGSVIVSRPWPYLFGFRAISGPLKKQKVLIRSRAE